MNANRRFGWLRGLAIAITLLAVGGLSYGAGLAAGHGGAMPFNGGDRDGFGFFGIIPALVVLFLFFGLLRGIAFRAFGGGRGGWGRRGGWGGPGNVPPGIEERLAEWHTKAHQEPSRPDATGTTTV